MRVNDLVEFAVQPSSASQPWRFTHVAAIECCKAKYVASDRVELVCAGKRVWVPSPAGVG